MKSNDVSIIIFNVLIRYLDQGSANFDEKRAILSQILQKRSVNIAKEFLKKSTPFCLKLSRRPFFLSFYFL